MICLSQLNALPDNYLVWWLVAFGGLALIVQTVLNVLDRFKKREATSTMISPDPLQVQEVEKLATKAEMMSMETRLSNKIAEVENDMAEERKVARTANGTLHRRIDELVETLAETKGLLTGVKENTERLLNRQLK